VEIKDIKAIIDLMKKNSITEFELEEKDSKLRLKRGLSGSPAVVQSDEAISMIAFGDAGGHPDCSSFSSGRAAGSGFHG
jgi:biotin carboxyl carrier protein